MKITWLGQGGLLLRCNGLQIIVDPYFSDSVAAINPRNYRRVPVQERFFDVRPDVLVFTHEHLDHYDPETVEKYLTRFDGITVLAPGSVWPKVRQYGKAHNYVLFDRHTQWTQNGIRFTAVAAAHSDNYAIGVIVSDGEQTVYLTGDTLYNTEIFADLPDTLDAIFLPVNGVGNNMNMADAARFAEKTGARQVFPIHIGMFDALSADAFICENKRIPIIYEEMEV